MAMTDSDSAIFFMNIWLPLIIGGVVTLILHAIFGRPHDGY
jgi:hypothetical protein